jgi:hypothetical protein
MLSGPPTDALHLDVLKKLKDNVDLNLGELDLAFQSRPLGAVAWVARNLLELALWSEQCGKSKENANEFMLDATRDAADMVNIPDGPLVLTSLKPVRQDLLDKAAADGFDIEQAYQRVNEIAQSAGRADTYKYFNKLLSKFAHPTAIAVFSLGSDKEKGLRDKFYELGKNFGMSALAFLNEAASSIVNKTNVTLATPPQSPAPSLSEIDTHRFPQNKT